MSLPSIVQPGWDERIPDGEWSVYHRVIGELRRAGVPFAFGGAFATAVYTGRLRNTKDFDCYILPQDRPRMVEAVHRAGLEDHFDRLSYDRSWIYRASQGDVIVDAIWQMANHRAQVDGDWLRLGPEITLRGERLRCIPIEELIWSKLYVLQRERSDWNDVLNVVDAHTTTIDWDRLLRRLSEDIPVLGGALSVYAWLAPDRAPDIPPAIWSRVGLNPPEQRGNPELIPRRAALLDSRPWFRVVD
jgi:Nucleotidyl transferase of unknown function (DUF2204)